MVVHDNGKIAIKWAIQRRMPKTVKIDGTDKYYVFTPRLNIFMEWIEPEYIGRLLSHKEKSCNCNNGTYQNAFEYASLMDVNLYEFGDRYTPEGAPYKEA